jgi:hypothetical protein
MGKPIPSTAVFDRRIWTDRLIQIYVGIVGVSRDNAVLRPSDERGLMDSETGRGFLFRQHSSISKSIVTLAERVSVDQISNPQRGEASIALAAPR